MTDPKSAPAIPTLACRCTIFNSLAFAMGGLEKAAVGVADVHGITLEQSKANCRQAAEELIAERGHLQPHEQPVYDWARN